ncbi:MAG: cytochrome C oxidase, partial [Hyphomicrobiales bacterium]|nr:cytochrome C oxidase [Hyphomicrobiales bacterium]
MRVGELGLIVAFAALAAFSLLVTAKAWTPEYAFHAALFALGSVAAVIGIFKRYGARSAEWPAQEIDGKPNY